MNSPYQTSLDKQILYILSSAAIAVANTVIPLPNKQVIVKILVTPMRIGFVHAGRRSATMADMRHDLATLNSQYLRCLGLET